MNEIFTIGRIVELCGRPRSIDYIIRHLDGIDPIALSQLLQDLERKEIVRKHDKEYWVAEDVARLKISELIDLDAPPLIKRFMGQFEIFKKPHPLDFEWRNSPNTVRYLSEKVLQFAGYDKKILILGMPTLFASLCEKTIVQRIGIVERNKAVTGTLKVLAGKTNDVFEADIFEAMPEAIGKFDIVVMDPPWYSLQFRQFVWLASQCLNVCGKLLISIPSYNTRPGIMKQRVEWLKYCETLGLCIESLECSTLEYCTPFFESNAQRYSGVQVSAFWRRGDLLTLTKLDDKIVQRPELDTNDKDGWREVEINEVRIRVDTSLPDEDEELLIESLVPPNGVLPSVSSRDERRQAANVWTSGNRIFRTNKPARLLGLLTLIKEGVEDSTRDFEICMERFSVVLELEKQEYDLYVKWFYSAMESDFTQAL